MTKFKRYEVVCADSSAFLVSASHQACRYEAPGGKPLVPGCYLVLWPQRTNDSMYGSELRYLGPFASHAEAQWLQTSAMNLGIIEPKAATINPQRRLDENPVSITVYGRVRESPAMCMATS